MENFEGPQRQVVKARDIMYFFGKRERQSFKMMAEMRKHFKKKKHQPITVTNFCEYYGILPDDFYVAMRATDRYGEKSSEHRKNKVPAVVPDFVLPKEKPYEFSRKIE